MAGRVIDVTMQMIDKVTGPLNKMSLSLTKSNDQWRRAGREITRTGRDIYKVGQGLTTAVTLPIAAAGTAAFNNFGEVDKTLRLVQQTMGSTSAEAGILEKALMDAAGNSVFGMNDAAEASLNFARAGFTAQQAADMVAPSFSLAAGTATDLSLVTEGLGSTMKLFGADTSEAANYADIFAVAQAQANTTVTDMFESMSAAGSTFATVGWNVKDLAVATGVLGDAMISGSEAGNSFKSGLANLSSNEKAISMLEKLRVEVINDKGEFDSFVTVQEKLHNAFAGLTQEEQMNAAAALFGKNQMAKWMTLINRSPADIQNMENALNKADGSAQSMADALMNGAGGAVESLKSSLDVLGYSLGQFVAKYATPIIKKITEIIDKFNALDDSTKDQIVRWAAVAAAVGPALMVFGKVVMTLGNVVFTIGKIGGAITKAGGALAALTGPGAIAIAIVLAIAAAALLIIQNWDQVKAAALQLWASIQPILTYIQTKWTELATHIQTTWQSSIQPAWQQFSAKVGELWTAAQPVLTKLGEIYKEVFEIKLKFAIDMAVTYFQWFFDIISSTVTLIINLYTGLIDFVMGVFTGNWQQAWDGVAQIFSSCWEFMESVAEAACSFMSGLVSGVASAFSGLLSLIESVRSAASTIGGGSHGFNAVGTSFWRGGTTWVHERGAELIDLPRGTRIYPHSESLKMAYQEGQANGGGRGGNVNITVAKLADSIQVRNDSDIEAIAAALANKLELTAHNIGGGEIGYAY